MKKVNNIILVVKKTYDLYAEDFHNHFTNLFNASLIANHGYNSTYDINSIMLNKFIDKCVYYRLGVSDVMPQKSDIIYDLSNSLSPEELTLDTDDIYGRLVYCAYPAKLIKKFRSQLEANKLPDPIIDLITSKLEINTE